MCTVSFYKFEDKVILTSNRDEKIDRPPALPPRELLLENTIVYCPVDPKAGGTWFVVNKNGNAFILLNGAEKKHTSQSAYRKSRGLILLDIAVSKNYINKWNTIDLHRIENFTVVVYSKRKLAQLRWDGIKKSCCFLDINHPHIWSSSTLYDEANRRKREKWFYQFLSNKPWNISNNDLIEFHTNTKKEDEENGLIINRNNKMLTKNVTQVELSNKQFVLRHWDLTENKETIIEKTLS